MSLLVMGFRWRPDPPQQLQFDHAGRRGTRRRNGDGNRQRLCGGNRFLSWRCHNRRFWRQCKLALFVDHANRRKRLCSRQGWRVQKAAPDFTPPSGIPCCFLGRTGAPRSIPKLRSHAFLHHLNLDIRAVRRLKCREVRSHWLPRSRSALSLV